MNIVKLQDIKSTHRNPLHSYTLTMRMEKEMAIHSSVLAWRIPGTWGSWWAAVHWVTQSRTRLKQLAAAAAINEYSKAAGYKINT